jgi:hypothetical protein
MKQISSNPHSSAAEPVSRTRLAAEDRLESRRNSRLARVGTHLSISGVGQVFAMF